MIVTKEITVIDDIATGQNARKIRKEARITLRAVCGVMNLSPPYISDLELGRRKWNAFLADEYLDAIEKLKEKAVKEHDKVSMELRSDKGKA